MSHATETSLDARIAALAARDLPLAISILREAVRIPADHVDQPRDQGGDPLCGLSNHERPRLEYLRRTLVEIGAVADPADAGFDGFGNLVWTVEDPNDGIPRDRKRVIMFDGHCDTVRALRPDWRTRIGPGVDAYDGLTDLAGVNRASLRSELGYLPPDDEWNHLLFGRGSADQLGGVVSQMVATRILRELTPEGALRGAIVRSYATVAEEDNDGGGPMFVTREWRERPDPDRLPDVVILTDSTGHATEGALGLYRGQRGRMQIEVRIGGRSCHGSMPSEGLNPLEHGGAILAEAARRARDEGFLDHPFLGAGTRTASTADLATPSDCAVPERFTFRFDRRMTAGETPERALAEVESLDAVRAARAAGLTVEIAVPVYEQPTWRGTVPGNPQIYRGWVTGEDHPAVVAAVEAWRRAVTPHIDQGPAKGGALRREPRVSRWIFSTDGVGFVLPADGDGLKVPTSKNWVRTEAAFHPPMIGIGPGIEQNTHKIGECVDVRELQHAAAFLARYPGVFAGAPAGTARS